MACIAECSERLAWHAVFAASAVCAALCGPGRARQSVTLESDLRGEGVAYVDVGPRLPVTVGLPVAGTRMCADQAMKSME